MDTVKRLSRDFSMLDTVSDVHKKADAILLRIQQALGRTASSKSQYMTIHHGETFNKKHIRMLSVVLFLGCVSAAAIACGIYYAFYWKPCTKKFLYTKQPEDDNVCASEVHELWDKYAWTESEKTASCSKCLRSNSVFSPPQK
ncbi:uncharacterized protein LOC132735071 [Ruditapes philippinarum]|uniref:uncharacterized protein LOC132735071 n=1 Tax=Ruditapes philippinarum TaxID=129788 RepID=UPI00295BD1C1|nr:uncharacterized protein LOC132735071 [Ruditapes philippinarum]